MTSPVTHDARVRRAYVRRTAGVLAIVVGVLNMTSVLRPGLYRRFEFLADVLPGAVVSASAAVSVTVGLLLAGLALGLGRGKRRAWRIAVALLAFETVLQATQAHYLLSAVSVALLVLLVLARGDFVGRSEPVARSGALRIGLALVGASVLLGWLAVSALATHLQLDISGWQRLLDTVQGFAGVTTQVTAPDTRQSDAVYYLLVAMTGTTLLVTGWLFLRAPRELPPRTDEEDALLRSLISGQAGDDSLGYFALRDDRSLVWSASGRACVSYRLVGSTMLAAGDPLGVRSDWPQAIDAFLDAAIRRSAVPAVAGCSEPAAQAWTRHRGLTALEFGDEAVLDAETFTLEGRAMRNVRQAVARAERTGLTVRIRRLGDMPVEELDMIRTQVDVWRGAELERGFSMALGRLDAAVDPDSILVLAEIDSVPRALLVLVPWGRDGLSLDLMRRDAHAESGVNELMISRLMCAAPSLGVTRVSLNFAAFREAIERSERFGAPIGTRLWGRTLRLAAHGSQADSLYRFNAKFAPEWRRRFLVYPVAVGLPRVAWAYLRAEGMVPSLRRTVVARRRRAVDLPAPREESNPSGLPADTGTTDRDRMTST